MGLLKRLRVCCPELTAVTSTVLIVLLDRAGGTGQCVQASAAWQLRHTISLCPTLAPVSRTGSFKMSYVVTRCAYVCVFSFAVYALTGQFKAVHALLQQLACKQRALVAVYATEQ